MVDLLVDLLLLLLFLGRGASTPFCEACVVNEVQMRREWWNHEKIKQKGERLCAGATTGSKYENYYEKKNYVVLRETNYTDFLLSFHTSRQ